MLRTTLLVPRGTWWQLCPAPCPAELLQEQGSHPASPSEAPPEEKKTKKFIFFSKSFLLSGFHGRGETLSSDGRLCQELSESAKCEEKIA